MFFCLLLILLEIVLWFTTDSLFSELYSLYNNKYEYSVVMKESVGVNDFYRYNAAIRFSTSPDSDVALKAEAIMQIYSSEYNNDLFWNANIMTSDSIAISQNIARTYGIGVGDKLYSKHIVDGNVCEYTIVKVLPSLVDSRYTDESSHDSGVIVMGYDPMYEENITHDVIVFTKASINDLTQNNNKSAVDILYREDEIASVIEDLLPYVLLFVLAGVICSVGYVVLMTKEISANFKRYVLLGYQPVQINKSYNQNVVLAGSLIEMGIITVNAVLGFSRFLCLPELFLVFSSNLCGVIVIIFTAHILKKKLWRR